MEGNKLEAQRRELVKLKQEFENESTPGGEMWNEDEIRQLLKQLPLALFNQGNRVVEAMVDAKTKKQMLKKIYSQNLLIANSDKSLKAANERKAWAENQENYLEAEEAVIIAEGAQKAAELHYAAYENLYTAVKKASSMVTGNNLNQIR